MIDRSETFRKKLYMILATLLVGTLGITSVAWAAQGIVDPARDDYYKAFKDKWVVYVPVFMGLSLTEGWGKSMQLQSDALGYKFEIRNTNFDTSAGTRILSQLINGDPKPDILVVHNPDVTSYARLEKKAEKGGIFVIQLNMKSLATTAGFVGGDATRIGEMQAQAVVDHCGANTDTSHKVLILTGPTTAPWSVYLQTGYDHVFSKHPKINIVARQSTGNYSSSKAKHITEVVLQQNPTLCGIIGVWDIPSLGTAAALKSAGKLDQVFFTTNGGGNQFACEAILDGRFDHYVSFSVPGQSRDLTSLISVLLEAGEKGADPQDYSMLLYSPLRRITKESIKKNGCWTLETLGAAAQLWNEQ